jgi:O-acetylhomoserine/O-acetylserine sulfhydrylase-like pyridoxal-dependent enzyme
MNFETLAIKSTQMTDANAGAVASPIYLSTTFERETDGSYAHGYIYARNDNPNRQLLEKSLAVLEAGEVGLPLLREWRLQLPCFSLSSLVIILSRQTMLILLQMY